MKQVTSPQCGYYKSIMENRSLALRYLSEAVNMDSTENHQAAFAKYLQSLHVLTVYLNDMFTSLGFKKMLEKKKEIEQVVSMIRECSDRVTVIVGSGKNDATNGIIKKEEASYSTMNVDVESFSSEKVPVFETLQNENKSLLKRYQWRFERSNDERARTNLRLELERQLVENAIITKRKYDIAMKQLQKERIQVMENEMKKLLENRQNLTGKQREKQELYISVLQYTKTETWPCTWKLNPHEMSATEATKKIFQKTITCNEHPLSHWLIVVQTNIKREIETKLKEFSDYKLLPDQLSEENLHDFIEQPSKCITYHHNTETVTISPALLVPLQKFLELATLEITNTIENVLEIFYLIYKSLLPEDSEEICHQLIESHVLEPIWTNFLILFRISNIFSEYKISLTMEKYRNSDPAKFGFFSDESNAIEIYASCISIMRTLPRSRSISEKLKVLVEVCQIICGTPSHKKINRRKLGADELIPLLCYVIVKSGMPQLSSECYAIEQLFDMKYMFGEEGYALSSFMTALKYIEIRKVIDEGSG